MSREVDAVVVFQVDQLSRDCAVEMKATMGMVATKLVAPNTLGRHLVY